MASHTVTTSAAAPKTAPGESDVCKAGTDFDDDDFEFEFAEPLVAFDAGVLPPFHDWRLVFPFLAPLVKFREALLAEATASKTPSDWTEWPETNLYKGADAVSASSDWRVVPIVYTFPADDPTQTVWVERECSKLPLTTRLLKAIPGVRTALYSRLGPETELAVHRGWAPLANHVLRCHFALSVPGPGVCGVVADRTVAMHQQGEILVFDDSKEHFAFNRHPSGDRIVLIFDIARPEGLSKGEAEGGETAELMEFIASFAAGRS
jgi:hypothetical protein